MRDTGYHVPRGSILRGIMLFIIVPEQGSFKNAVFFKVWGFACIAAIHLVSEEEINVMELLKFLGST
jgi:hypothetical protein